MILPISGCGKFWRASRGARCRMVVISVLRDDLRAWIARQAFEQRQASTSGTVRFANASTLARAGGLWHVGIVGGDSRQTISRSEMTTLRYARRGRTRYDRVRDYCRINERFLRGRKCVRTRAEIQSARRARRLNRTRPKSGVVPCRFAQITWDCWVPAFSHCSRSLTGILRRKPRMQHRRRPSTRPRRIGRSGG